MDEVVTYEMRDIIIVEKSNGNVVENGSRFYCGCCGNVLGVSNRELTFPCSANKFFTSLKNKSFDMMLFGLYHRKCGHTMFSFKKEYAFMTLENYLKNTNQS